MDPDYRAKLRTRIRIPDPGANTVFKKSPVLRIQIRDEKNQIRGPRSATLIKNFQKLFF